MTTYIQKNTAMKIKGAIVIILTIILLGCARSISGTYLPEKYDMDHPIIRLRDNHTFSYEYKYSDPVHGTWTRRGNEVKLESKIFFFSEPYTSSRIPLYEPGSIDWPDIEYLYIEEYFENFREELSSYGRYCDIFRVDGDSLWPLSHKGDTIDYLKPYHKSVE